MKLKPLIERFMNLSFINIIKNLFMKDEKEPDETPDEKPGFSPDEKTPEKDKPVEKEPEILPEIPTVEAAPIIESPRHGRDETPRHGRDETETQTLKINTMDEPTKTPPVETPAKKDKKKDATKIDDNTMIIIGVVLVVLIIAAFVYWNYTRKKTKLEHDQNVDGEQQPEQQAYENNDVERYFPPVN